MKTDRFGQPIIDVTGETANPPVEEPPEELEQPVSEDANMSGTDADSNMGA